MSKNDLSRGLYSIGEFKEPTEGERHMTEPKAFIYCMVLDCKENDVLFYRQNLLIKKAVMDRYIIHSKLLLIGKVIDFIFYEMKTLLNHARGERVDTIYIYDRARVTPNKGLYGV